MARNETDRTSASSIAREEEFTFLRGIVDSASELVIAIDADSTIVFANAAVADALGYPPDDVVDRPLTTIIPERYRDPHLTAVEEYLETDERTLDWEYVEFPALRADGSEITLGISLYEFTVDDEPLFAAIAEPLETV